MYLVSIQAFAETASFRLPETHTFHKTLPLPPYTTCVGLLGAAFGFSPEGSQQFVEENEVRIGVSGRDFGSFRDLWKHRKVKTKEVTPDVLLREYLVDLSFVLVYGTEDETVARKIFHAFRDPVYALTAGQSDSLLVVRSIEQLEVEEEEFESVRFCVVPRDLTGIYEVDRSVLDLPIVESIRSPQVFNLPVRFTFDGDRRTVDGREFFTYVGHPIHLKEPIQGFCMQSPYGRSRDPIPVVLR